MDLNHRVVVTGIGVISPLGLDVASTWQGLISGRSGIGCITHFDPSAFETHIAAEVKDFDPLNFIDRKEVKRMDRFVQFAAAASFQALAAAGLKIDGKSADDIGVLIGSGIGGIMTLSQQFEVLFQKGPRRVSPFLIPMYIPDMASGHISILTGAKGPNFCPVSSCSSGADALGEALEIIRRGDAQAMLAGGSEASIVPIGIAGFNSAGALSRQNEDPQKASRPFDLKRDGFVMGEGAVVLVLESFPFALSRGAPILAEFLSYGASSDAHHITHPPESGEGGIRAMKRALAKARLKPEEVDYINAHGTSTPLNDKTETKAIKVVFGEYAYKVPVSSTKSMVGHLLGAGGAFEAAVCIWAIREGIIPPTINYEYPDPECDLDYVPNVAREAEVRVALSNSFGFGGHNSTLIFSRFEP